MLSIPETFVCAFCDEVKDFYSQAVITAAPPDRADFVITGMPSSFMGFCLDCLEGAEL
jgi:hypothetical protein